MHLQNSNIFGDIKVETDTELCDYIKALNYAFSSTMAAFIVITS